MTRDELEAMASIPGYFIVHVGGDCTIAERAPRTGATRILGHGRLHLSRSACELALAEIRAAIDVGWQAGLAQALLALEDQPDEATALALRAHRRLTWTPRATLTRAADVGAPCTTA